MSDDILVTSSQPPRWAILLIALGSILFGLALAGFVVVQLLPDPAPDDHQVGMMDVTPSASATVTQPALTRQPVNRTQPPVDDPVVERQIVPPPTRTPTPTSTPTPTDTPVPTIAPTRTPLPPPEVTWTQEEFNALSWMCYGEVSGMREVEVDACLSVISTVRARYAYPNAFSYTTVLDALLAPNQFHVPIHTDRPSPDPEINYAVEQYQYGLRGSCNGYLYFNSISGGPAACTIRSSTGLFVNFHNQPLR